MRDAPEDIFGNRIGNIVEFRTVSGRCLGRQQFERLEQRKYARGAAGSGPLRRRIGAEMAEREFVSCDSVDGRETRHERGESWDWAVHAADPGAQCSGYGKGRGGKDGSAAWVSVCVKNTWRGGSSSQSLKVGFVRISCGFKHKVVLLDSEPYLLGNMVCEVRPSAGRYSLEGWRKYLLLVDVSTRYEMC